MAISIFRLRLKPDMLIWNLARGWLVAPCQTIWDMQHASTSAQQRSALIQRGIGLTSWSLAIKTTGLNLWFETEYRGILKMIFLHSGTTQLGSLGPQRRGIRSITQVSTGSSMKRRSDGAIQAGRSTILTAKKLRTRNCKTFSQKPNWSKTHSSLSLPREILF